MLNSIIHLTHLYGLISLDVESNNKTSRFIIVLVIIENIHIENAFY